MSKDVLSLIFACDHAAFEVKEKLISDLKSSEHSTHIQIQDVGTFDSKSCDYPDFANKAAMKMKDLKNSKGIFICGTGIGISIAGNRHENISAALVHNSFEVKKAKELQCNVIALGARVLGYDMILELVKDFIN